MTEFDRWLATAATGDVFVYHTGNLLFDAEPAIAVEAAAARKAAKKNLVSLTQDRVGPERERRYLATIERLGIDTAGICCRHYIAEKRAPVEPRVIPEGAMAGSAYGWRNRGSAGIGIHARGHGPC